MTATGQSPGNTLARTVDFDGHPVTTVLFEGRIIWVAAQVGEAMGYPNDGARFADKMTGEWADDFIPSTDFDTLRGERLAAFMELLERSTVSVEGAPLRSGGSLTVLYESGMHLALLKTRKPAGRRLRRMLADHVLPQLRATGTATLPGAPPPAGLTEADVVSLVERLLCRPPQRVLPLVESEAATQVIRLQTRVDKLESDVARGVIDPTEAKLLKARLRDAAQMYAKASDKFTRRGKPAYGRILLGWRTVIQNKIGFNGKNADWLCMPRDVSAAAWRLVDGYVKEAQRAENEAVKRRLSAATSSAQSVIQDKSN